MRAGSRSPKYPDNRTYRTELQRLLRCRSDRGVSRGRPKRFQGSLVEKVPRDTQDQTVQETNAQGVADQVQPYAVRGATFDVRELD